jgi:hypothetical protein
VESVPLAVAAGPTPVPLPVAPIAPTELLLTDGTPGLYDHEEEAEVIVAFYCQVSVSMVMCRGKQTYVGDAR